MVDHAVVPAIVALEGGGARSEIQPAGHRRAPRTAARRTKRITGPDVDLDVQFAVEVIGGEAGRRLAMLQAEAVLDVLTWLHERHAEPR